MTSMPCPILTRLQREPLANGDQSRRRGFQDGQASDQALLLRNTLATILKRVACWGMFSLLLAGLPLGRASGEEIVLYGAGSLREVMTQIAAGYQKTRGMQVRTDFGPSGLMRERIARGEQVDVFASADLGHPLTLQREGRAMVVAMFTRNTLCAVALPRVGLTTTNAESRPGRRLYLGHVPTGGHAHTRQFRDPRSEGPTDCRRLAAQRRRWWPGPCHGGATRWRGRRPTRLLYQRQTPDESAPRAPSGRHP
jgi:hypothetical protein